MSSVVATVVGGMLVLVLGYLLKTVDDLRTAVHKDLLDLTGAQGKTAVRLESVEQRLTASTADLGGRIDALGLNMEQRFAQVDRQFDQVDQRFDQVDQRFEQVDQRFDQVDRRFEQVDQRFEGADRRFAGIDRQLVGLATTLGEVNEKLDRHLALPHSA